MTDEIQSEDKYNLETPTPNTNYLLSDQILVGSYPYENTNTCNDISKIIDTGRNIFINLTTRSERNYEYNYVPDVNTFVKNLILINHEINDHSVPSDEESFYDFMHLLYTLTKIPTNKFYIHCIGGHGRTGLVCGCLLKHMGYTSDEALEIVTKWHSTRDNMSSYPSPETTDQINFVRNYNTNQN
jgi:protein-tyrosine phosphatase